MNGLRSWMSPLVLLCLLIVGVLSWLRLGELQYAAQDAAMLSGTCATLAEEIERLRAAEAVAVDQQQEEIDTGKIVLEQARACGISETQVRSINRLASAKVEDTDYERADTVITLQQMEMEKLIRLLLAFTNDSTAVPTQLTLRATPTRNGGRELWEAEVILTQLLYGATSPDRT